MTPLFPAKSFKASPYSFSYRGEEQNAGIGF